MNIPSRESLPIKLKKLLVSVGVISLLQACGQVESQEQKSIKINGSSTVYPISNLIGDKYNDQIGKKIVEVQFSGTIEGFEKFCTGETDISNASIPIPKQAMAQCKSNGIAYIELPVAFDALTVVINNNNDWAETMTVEELKTMWEPSADGKITRWNQVNANWPDQSLDLFGPGTESGTFDYFTTAIVGQKGASRQDYVYSRDDEAIAKGVVQDSRALGYFGFAYYEENKDKLKAVAIDSGSGPVMPSVETVKNATYQPLSRPLFIYVNAKAAQENRELQNFVEFYLKQANKVVAQVGYIPLPDSAYHIGMVHFENHQVGTVFAGKPALNVTIEELLRQKYAQEGETGYVF